MDADLLVSFLTSAVRVATPLLLAALGETLAERGGVINLGIEGAMLAGALAAAIGSTAGGPWSGTFAAAATGAILSLGFGLIAVAAGANQIISGTAITLGAVGATGAIYREVYGSAGVGLSLPTFPVIPIPALIGSLCSARHCSSSRSLPTSDMSPCRRSGSCCFDQVGSGAQSRRRIGGSCYGRRGTGQAHSDRRPRSGRHVRRHCRCEPGASPGGNVCGKDDGGPGVHGGRHCCTRWLATGQSGGGSALLRRGRWHFSFSSNRSC